MNPKAVQLTPFSLRNPTGGGQVRAAKLRRHIEGLGVEVFTLGFDPSSPPEQGYSYSDATSSYANCPPWDLTSRYSESQHIMDYAMGATFAECRDQFEILAQKCPVDFQFLILEHPWLHSFSKKLTSSKGVKPITIASTHNAEYYLKLAIAQAAGTSPKEREAMALRKIEEEYLDSADYIIAVSRDDATRFSRDYGVAASKIIVCPNASDKIDPFCFTSNYIHDLSNGPPFALFVGSGHPPNAEGFMSYLSGPSALIASEYRIVVAGSVCDLLERRIASDACLKGMYESGQILLLGVQEETTLAQLTLACKVFIVPLTTGGGTSLKTAQGLINNKIVLTTPQGARGFEHALNHPNVYLAETKREFKVLLFQLMSTRADLLYGVDNAGEALSQDWSDSFSPINHIFETNIKQ